MQRELILEKLAWREKKTFAGKGVSYCATCDGPFFRNLELVVAGGGDSAIEESNISNKICNQSTSVHRRNELRASKVMQERALNNEKIQFHWDSEVSRGLKETKKFKKHYFKRSKDTNEENNTRGWWNYLLQ